MVNVGVGVVVVRAATVRGAAVAVRVAVAVVRRGGGIAMLWLGIAVLLRAGSRRTGS